MSTDSKMPYALGFAAGVIVLAIRLGAWPEAGWIFNLAIGLLAALVAFWLGRVWQEDYGPLGIITGLVVGTAFTLGRFFLSPDAELPASIFSGVFIGLTLGWLVRQIAIDRHKHPPADSIRKRLRIDEEHNLLGKRLDRFIHWATTGSKIPVENDRRIDFTAPLPLIDGLFMICIPLHLTALALWGVLEYPGGGRLLGIIQDGSSFERGTLLAVVLADLAWILLSLWEALEASGEDKDPEERKKEQDKSWFTRKAWIIRFIVIGIFIAAWWMTDFLFWDYIYSNVREDPNWAWWLLLIPSAVWLIHRFVVVRNSGMVLTDRVFKKGTVEFLLGDDYVHTIDRSKLTNFSIKRGPWRRLWGYWLLIVEGIGKEDRAFRRTRVRQGDALERKLQSTVQSGGEGYEE